MLQSQKQMCKSIRITSTHGSLALGMNSFTLTGHLGEFADCGLYVLLQGHFYSQYAYKNIIYRFRSVKYTIFKNIHLNEPP